MVLYYRYMASTGERKKRAANQGPNLAPLKDYLQAQRLNQEGKHQESLAALSQSIGSPEPLPKLEGNLNKVFDNTSPLSDLTLTLALAETKRRRS